MKTELSPRRWLIVAFLTLFMSVMNFNLIVYPACAVDTMAVYGVDQAALTTFASVTSVVGVLGGIVFGPLLDKKGSRNVVMIGMIIGIVLFAVRAFVTSYVLALILTFLASFFIGVCQVAAPKVLDTWFTKETVGVAVAFQGRRCRARRCVLLFPGRFSRASDLSADHRHCLCCTSGAVDCSWQGRPHRSSCGGSQGWRRQGI